MHLYSMTVSEVCQPLLLEVLNCTDLTYLFHWLACVTISFKQDGKVLKLEAIYPICVKNYG